MQSNPALPEGDCPRSLFPDEVEKLLAHAPWRRLVVLGDSVIDGVGDAAEMSWVDRVTGALRIVQPNLSCLNLDKRDLSIPEIRSQHLKSAIAFNGDLALISCGGSDVLRRTFDADVTEVELSRIIGPLREAGCEVMTIGLCDTTNSRFAQVERDAELHARLQLLFERILATSLRHGALHIDLTIRPTISGTAIWNTDGKQLNSQGHAIVTAAVIHRLGAFLSVGT
jgi:lysophospholipase L1-like esterase